MVFVFGCFTSNSFAVIRYVKTGSAGTAPYTSWATASNDLQAVINACSAGDEIWIAAGTYKPNRRADALTVITATNRNNAFVLKSGVKIYGGFTGLETLLSQRNVTANVVTLSGDIGTVGLDTDNCYHVVISAGNNNATRLDGVQVVLGNANGSAFATITVNTRIIVPTKGGGVYAAASTAVFDECTIRRNLCSVNGAGIYDTLSAVPNISNCVITQNVSGNNGAGIYNAGSSPVISNCDITQNDAGNHGGGIYNDASSPDFTSCDITQNEAVNNGGGLYNSSSTPELNSNSINNNEAGNNGAGIYNTGSVINCNGGFITENIAGNHGGGIYNVSSSDGNFINIKILNNSAVRGGGLFNNTSSPYISNCALYSNSASIYGGAFFNVNGNNIEFDQCAFNFNTATFDGGALYIDGGTAPKFKNCSFRSNSAINAGGGIYIISADVVFINCLVAGNVANFCGGISFGLSDVSFINCTVASNKGVNNFGGIGVSAGSTLILRNSIVWGNESPIVDNFGGGGMLNVTYSNIEGGAAGVGNINSNPMFTSPQPAANAPTTSGEYSVLKCSPVINAGSNSLVPGGITQDIDGNVRINYGIVDMGAYEKKLAVKAPSGIVYVDHTKTGNGSNWANATPSLADALLTAKYDGSITQIWVAKGTYYPEYNATNLASLVCNPANRYNSFVLVPDVNIYGGFINGAASLAERDPISNVTTLSGDINLDNTSTGNTYHVVISAGSVGTAVLDGFTITGGNADYSGNTVTVNGITVTSFYGGGMGISLSSPAINDCIVEGNYGDHGGAISVLSGAPVFSRCIIRNNTAGLYGGALDHWVIGPPSNAVFNNCLITGNRSNNVGGAFVNTYPSVIRLNNTTVSGNFAVNQGGGLWSNGQASEIFRNSILWGNKVGASASNIHVVGPGTANATYCAIEGGYAGTGNISTDPLFINPQPASSAPTALGNYHLQKCSPAINTGSNAAIPSGITKDLDSSMRIHLGVVDMGAFEKHLAKPTKNGIVYVDSSNTSVVGDGSSWAEAVTELADAIKEANGNPAITEIWVAKGTYKPLYNAADDYLNSICHTTDRDASFLLAPDVKLYGGFAGWESSLPERDFSINRTVLSGDIANLNDTSDNCYHVIIASNIENANVDGFDIVQGNARSLGMPWITINGYHILKTFGGGLYSFRSSIEVDHCRFMQNSGHYGGAFHTSIISGISDETVVRNSTFIENISLEGAAINNAGKMRVENCSISGNQADFGGGIINFDQITLVNTLITGNYALLRGGGIRNHDSVSLFNSVIYGNRAVNEAGGGISNSGSSKLNRIHNSIVYNNLAVANNNILPGTAVAIVSHSIIEGGHAGIGNFNLDPMFISPQSPASAPTTSGDYRLLPCSPAINSGNNDSIPPGITKDLDSLDRIKFNTVDIGAYEKQDVDLANTTWKGINTNWNDKINWCGGYIPSDTTNVTIPLTSNQPVVGAGFTNAVKNISLAGGTSLTVNNTSTFTINGAYSNSGSTIHNLGEWRMAGNAVGQVFPGVLGNITAMHTLRINNPSGIGFNKSFSITGALIPEAGNIALNNDTITLRSTASATARIDSVRAAASFSYSGAGKFEIERYIPAKKAWRLLTAPVNAYQSINADWQEGQTNLSLVNSNTRPGYGTHISGPQTSSGFDFTNTNNPSMMVYNQVPNTLTGIANTNVLNLNHRQGYMLFIHGSRAYDLTLNHLGTPDATVLRSRGTIKTGDQPVAVAATGFTLVGNPYASSVDFDQLQRSNVGNKFTLWDPNRAGSYGFGGYVTFTKVGPIYVAAPPPVSAGIGQYIQSGAAFFVEGTGTAGTVTFQEKSKVDNNVSTVFRAADSAISSMRINLIKIAASTGIETAVDGTLAVFSSWAEQGVDDIDAAKKLNDNQNISLRRDDKILAIEARKPVESIDTLFLHTSQLQQRSYVLELIPENVARPGLQAWLEDRFLQQQVSLPLTDTSLYTFTVTADTASSSSSRFIIVFEQPVAGPVPVRFTSMKAVCEQQSVALQWTVAEELNIDHYTIEHSSNGASFTAIGDVAARHQPAGLYRFIHSGMVAQDGYYRIRSNGSAGDRNYSDIVFVAACEGQSFIAVYPNPVEDAVMQLHFTGLLSGSYQLQLLNAEGRIMWKGLLKHSGGSKLYRITIDQTLASGQYLLKVLQPSGNVQSISLLLK